MTEESNILPSQLCTKPSSRLCTPPISQPSKRRRAKFTINTIRQINADFGGIPEFLKCLDEVKSFTENTKVREQEEIFNFDFPKVLSDLAVTKESVITDLKEELRPHCSTLLTIGRFSRRQVTLLTKFIPQMPCHRTVRRDWKKQRNISGCDDQSFYKHLEDGIRKFTSKKDDASYYISMKNMLRWILFLVDDLMESSLKTMIV